MESEELLMEEYQGPERIYPFIDYDQYMRADDVTRKEYCDRTIPLANYDTIEIYGKLVRRYRSDSGNYLVYDKDHAVYEELILNETAKNTLVYETNKKIN